MAYEPPQPEDVLRLETFGTKVRNSLDYLKSEVDTSTRLHGAYDFEGLVSLVVNLEAQVKLLNSRIDGLAMQHGTKGGF